MDNQADRKLKARVNRVVGQVAGVQRMVDEGRYCVDILNQIAAARSALDALGSSCSPGISNRASSVTGRAPSTTTPVR